MIWFIYRMESTFHVTCVGIKPHQLDSFVIAPCGDQISSRAPGKAVNRSFMMFGAFKENRRLARGVIISATTIQKTLIYKFSMVKFYDAS